MSYTFQGRSIASDSDGFLLNPEDWSEGLRDCIAQAYGLELNDEQRLIIGLVRAYYDEYATSPALRALIAQLRSHGHPQLCSSAALARLFPQGAALMAARLAGLPRPARCI